MKGKNNMAQRIKTRILYFFREYDSKREWARLSIYPITTRRAIDALHIAGFVEVPREGWMRGRKDAQRKEAGE